MRTGSELSAQNIARREPCSHPRLLRDIKHYVRSDLALQQRPQVSSLRANSWLMQFHIHSKRVSWKNTSRPVGTTTSFPKTFCHAENTTKPSAWAARTGAPSHLDTGFARSKFLPLASSAPRAQGIGPGCKIVRSLPGHRLCQGSEPPLGPRAGAAGLLAWDAGHGHTIASTVL